MGGPTCTLREPPVLVAVSCYQRDAYNDSNDEGQLYCSLEDPVTHGLGAFDKR